MQYLINIDGELKLLDHGLSKNAVYNTATLNNIKDVILLHF